MAYRRHWHMQVATAAEPILYLLALGVGVGGLVGEVDVGSERIPYARFLVPGMLVAGVMTSATLDTVFGFFVRLEYVGIYRSMLNTPLTVGDICAGEVAWAVGRATFHAFAFLSACWMTSVLDFPEGVGMLGVAGIVAFAFAAVGLASATFLRSWVDFDLVLVALVPMFLFSGTFLPLDQLPRPLQWLTQASPLTHGVSTARSVLDGRVGWDDLLRVVALLSAGLGGLRVANRRLTGVLAS